MPVILAEVVSHGYEAFVARHLSYINDDPFLTSADLMTSSYKVGDDGSEITRLGPAVVELGPAVTVPHFNLFCLG